MNERGIDKIRRLEEENEEKHANVRGLEEVTNCCPQYREVIVQLTGIGEREREREREREGGEREIICVKFSCLYFAYGAIAHGLHVQNIGYTYFKIIMTYILHLLLYWERAICNYY